MAEAKPFASLSSGLLARKGDARPAMRRQMNNGNVETNAMTQDDLGWNDMGYDVDPDHNAPMDYDHEWKDLRFLQQSCYPKQGTPLACGSRGRFEFDC